ncbi:hypothetical protein RRG08_021885 [Elysia crispata]|uniref:Uncharacterized protein n=1 Tax=Elysia crispata TaxID=231223 RepID=A0AAE0ZGH2_9GAST|nr:hypothetical protein RRG08_021885 [Elysia crispata]
MSRVGSKDSLKIYSGHEVYTSNVVYKGVLHQFCFQLSSVIGSLRPSVVFGCKGILIIFGIFQAYETQRVLYVISAPISPIFSKQENTTFDLVSLAIVLYTCPLWASSLFERSKMWDLV